jgi:putative protease
VASNKIGKVTHFYPKIGVAVVELSSNLSVGDNITFSGSTDFSQAVSSMQVEHESITTAKKGETIGLKVDQPVKPGDTIAKE